jgi:hypothetical protein
MFPFGDFSLRRKRLAPCIIGGQIFGSADIQLINKRQIIFNIDARVKLKNVKIWYPAKIHKFLKIK